MYKIVYGYIFIIVISSLFNDTFGMERERALLQLMRKNIISVLVLNDYVVPVPNAYEALKKEASLPYVGIETAQYMLIKQINKNRRNIIKQSNQYLYKTFTEKVCNEVQRKIGYSSCKNIEISCYPSKSVVGEINVTMNMLVFDYVADHSSFKSRKLQQPPRVLNNIGTLWYDMIKRCVPKGQTVFIEICSPNKLSDFIMIENCGELGEKAMPVEREQDNNDAVYESDSDLFSADTHNYERLSRIMFVSFSFLVGVFIGGVIL